MPAVDAAKGGATANSYATVEEAGTYWDETYGGSEWADIDNDDKARLLITATRMIDRLSLLHDKASDTQALNFPVAIEGDGDDGFDAAKHACITQAFYLFQVLDVIKEGHTMAIQGTKSESIGPTSKQITGFNMFKKYDPEVYRALAKYLDFDFRISRG